MRATIGVRPLGLGDLSLIGEIDRSEHMDVEYRVEGERLVSRPVDLDIPAATSGLSPSQNPQITGISTRLTTRNSPSSGAPTLA